MVRAVRMISIFWLTSLMSCGDSGVLDLDRVQTLEGKVNLQLQVMLL